MRINNIVLFKLAQIGRTQEIGNTEGKAQVFNTLYYNMGGDIMDNLIGMIFGQWTVLERDYSKQYKTRDKRWICKCSCGNIKSVLGKYLKNGKSTSCGCSKKVDLTGQKFGKLLVVETLYNYNGNNRAIYHCVCDCGNEIYLGIGSLNRQTSCGCSRRVDSHVGEMYGKLTIKEMLYYYKNQETYCRCDCECGSRDNIIRWNSLVTGNTTSCGCNHSPSLIGQRFGMLIVNKEIPSNSNQRTWECICDCGNIVYRTSHELKRFYSCGCLKNKSVMEMYVKNILDDNHIEYIPQKKFDDCRDIFSLPFDFYLPQYNITIECDGIQHFEPVEHFGGKEQFKVRQKHDRIKTNYCLANGIQLIRLPYTLSFKDIQDIILDA